MAYITLNKASLAYNYQYLQTLFAKNKVDWAPVVKLLCGNKPFLEYVLSLGNEQVCDSRLSNLKAIKAISPETETIYIKPPAKRSIAQVVKYADVSFNSESYTIQLLSQEAQKQNKVHRIIIMIELGDLREGIMGDGLMDFYKKIFELPNIKVAGIGANLNCLSGVMPSKDKLIQLSLYKQLVEATFGVKIDGVSGGSSVMLPLLLNKEIPMGVNHFRIGETLFFGVNLFTGKTFSKMKSDILLLHSQIIEITEKPIIPYGTMENNPSGEMVEIRKEDIGKTHKRAILDIGLLDISNTDFLIPTDNSILFIGASSDMLVMDISNSSQKYKIGDMITFKMAYMGALRVMNSDYIDKRLI